MMPHFRCPQLLTLLLVGTGMTIAGSGVIRAIAATPSCLTASCIAATPESASSKHSLLAQGRLNNYPDFFDVGQQQLEQEISRMQQKPPSGVLTVKTAAGYWQPITSDAGSFSVWMTPGALSEETKELSTAVGTLRFNVLASNSGGDRAVVAYTDLPQSVTTQSPDIVLTAVRERLRSRTSYPLTDEQAISLASYPGRSLTFSGSGETITVRYYLANQRLYLVGAKHKGNSLSQTAATFFGSFQILTKL